MDPNKMSDVDEIGAAAQRLLDRLRERADDFMAERVAKWSKEHPGIILSFLVQEGILEEIGDGDVYIPMEGKTYHWAEGTS